MRYLPHTRTRITLAFVGLLSVAALAGISRRLEARHTQDTLVSGRDCATGAVLRTFPALNSFMPGGVLIDTTTASAPSLRTAGHGTWSHTGGRTYRAYSLAFLFNAAGAYAGTQSIEQSIEIGDDPNEFYSTATSRLVDAATGAVTVRCATAVARRMQ
ncbi:hypothetical protein LuPra_05614 [Luteitalea pratensis]|uniref:Uncharacterized protein n=1 Tax=Luteitalea pratensis TaxID=1855912 RepID=A0A143PVD7_LUTPR|nr:hypothetical protein [Luteitalea pratensis]AMY12341.1 hypothetical protein LuPra_05614 [Luteitalea pratensis]